MKWINKPNDGKLVTTHTVLSCYGSNQKILINNRKLSLIITFSYSHIHFRTVLVNYLKIFHTFQYHGLAEILSAYLGKLFSSFDSINSAKVCKNVVNRLKLLIDFHR